MKKILCSIVVSLTILSMLACSLTRALVKPAPTATPLPGSTGIASHRDLTPEENQALVDQAHAGSQGGALLDWAISSGVLGGDTPTAGAEVTTDEGDAYQGVALNNGQLIKYSMQGVDQPVYFLAQVGGSQADPKLALIEGPDSITIYSKDGIAVNNHKVVQNNSFGVSPVACRVGSLAQNLSQDNCANTSAQALEACMGGSWTLVEKGACIAGLGVAYAAVSAACFTASIPTGQTTTPPCIVAVMGVLAGAVFTKCPKYGSCLYSTYISPRGPSLKVTSWGKTGETQWINISPDPDTDPQWVNADLWRPQLSVSDDWGPPAIEPDPNSLSIASGQSVDIAATDCHGKTASLTAQAPDLSQSEWQTVRKDNPNENKPASPPQSNQPPAQNPAPPNDFTYQGQGPTAYVKESGMWSCPEESFRTVAISLRFNSDGTITYHDCKIEGVLMTCDLEFAPATTENTYEGSNLAAEGFTLTFPSKNLSEVVVTVQKASAADGSMLYCTFKLDRVNP